MCFDIYFKIIPAARWIRQRFAGDYAQTVTGSDFLTREWNSADAPEPYNDCAISGTSLRLIG
jgi:hypothetical protein